MDSAAATTAEGSEVCPASLWTALIVDIHARAPPQRGTWSHTAVPAIRVQTGPRFALADHRSGGPLRITTADPAGRATLPRRQSAPVRGRDVTTLLSSLSTPPRLVPSSTLLLPGLPPGIHSVTLGDRTATARVEADKTTAVELD